MIGCTPPEHVDFVPLQSAIQSLDRIANKIKEISGIHEDTRTLVSVSAKVGMDLSGRHFVRDGMMHKVCRSKVQLYYFVILENVPTLSAFLLLLAAQVFILLTETQEDKVGWTSDIRERIDRNLSVSDSDGSSTNGSPTTSSTRSKKFRRLWITLTLQTISLVSTFKTTQPEETVPIELCLVASLKNETWFRLQFPSDLVCLLLSPYFRRALFTPFRLLLSS
ncbi:hypothetical protein PsorP6_017453 [Peronosclerospora sorghi]|uniref:Uncharacterized protein n=1 Tax=Peronosclerospora sorghi TaxID=230839 RepID=A0ACC0WNV7_9STRA|nr:hypothetical protein PsorP6_017453 [Peronosclerospora sorghi]